MTDLTTALREAEKALQGILDDDDPATSLADQRARWSGRMTAAKAAVTTIRSAITSPEGKGEHAPSLPADWVMVPRRLPHDALRKARWQLSPANNVSVSDRELMQIWASLLAQLAAAPPSPTGEGKVSPEQIEAALKITENGSDYRSARREAAAILRAALLPPANPDEYAYVRVEWRDKKTGDVNGADLYLGSVWAGYVTDFTNDRTWRAHLGDRLIATGKPTKAAAQSALLDAVRPQTKEEGRG